jgi:hypothetical protein
MQKYAVEVYARGCDGLLTLMSILAGLGRLAGRLARPSVTPSPARLV